MSTAVCPHCAVTNDMAGDFCASCGLALPSVAPTGPRIITRKGTATTIAGQKLQSGELLNTTRRAARSLLSIGIINLAFGALYIFMIVTLYGGNLQRVTPAFLASTAAMLTAGALYMAMFWWANYNPLAATLVGLGVYLLRWVVDIWIQTTLVSSTSTNQNYNYGIVRIFMVIYLIRGVGAGWKHRQLEKQQYASSQPIRALPID